MTVFSAMERLAEPIGADFAMSDSKTQAALFNGFARMWERTDISPNVDMNMQACYIAEDLTPAAKRVLTMLARFAVDE